MDYIKKFTGIKTKWSLNTLTDESNLINHLYMRRELQNDQQYQNALGKFSTI